MKNLTLFVSFLLLIVSVYAQYDIHCLKGKQGPDNELTIRACQTQSATPHQVCYTSNGDAWCMSLKKYAVDDIRRIYCKNFRVNSHAAQSLVVHGCKKVLN
ncbi:uncharacterized protein BX664DRAFT_388200 [Halteromyces radiatus]|uniref:uncharacterized protein n=1 Tax=Halteromyces radiatus TaxID=101107 RepID=UPI00221E5C2D|nr:uncharacterized protein BX664DRAFT_388200 [Halteromyces radiatus]KAI8083104.1 hypothetical protein BX664DRAFT_388200 [Halteromyces radiatus]